VKPFSQRVKPVKPAGHRRTKIHCGLAGFTCLLYGFTPAFTTGSMVLWPMWGSALARTPPGVLLHLALAREQESPDSVSPFTLLFRWPCFPDSPASQAPKPLCFNVALVALRKGVRRHEVAKTPKSRNKLHNHLCIRVANGPRQK